MLIRNKWVRRLVVVLGVVVVLYVGSFAVLLLLFVQPTNDRDNSDPAKRQEMMRMVLRYGRLAPIPREASIKMIRTEGNMFTRSFRMAFDADPEVIGRWLVASKGIRTAQTVKSGAATKYVLNARPFQHAEVDVELSKHSVRIYFSYS